MPHNLRKFFYASETKNLVGLQYLEFLICLLFMLFLAATTKFILCVIFNCSRLVRRQFQKVYRCDSERWNIFSSECVANKARSQTMERRRDTQNDVSLATIMVHAKQAVITSCYSTSKT